MKNFAELTKSEAIEINGGNAYEVGYKVGKFFADLTDWYEGFFDGFRKGFDC
jgi:hypothetical protein